MDRTKFFFCYNRKTVDELIEHGFTYITRARNLNNNMPFTMFYLDEKLQTYLNKKNENKSL
ncbi:hypothetical protein [Rummeliibacillus sp. TYF-LIM-RU47]|uniref:hypothetical protein n=1 Tax=Rummeliibacillus sp. TYF-LIM-RU47 TaxID=2608406 RepID=UPI00123A8E9C|nr:hypothetical protein [Rummeliibacillus sp. TYF-LIM-RU47]